MTLSTMIAQCFVYGDSLKNSTVCIVIPEEAWVMKWAQERGLLENQQQKMEQLC